MMTMTIIMMVDLDPCHHPPGLISLQHCPYHLHLITNFEPRLEPSAPPLPNQPASPPFHLFAKEDAATGPITPREQVMSEIERVIEKEKKEGRK